MEEFNSEPTNPTQLIKFCKANQIQGVSWSKCSKYFKLLNGQSIAINQAATAATAAINGNQHKKATSHPLIKNLKRYNINTSINQHQHQQHLHNINNINSNININTSICICISISISTSTTIISTSATSNNAEVSPTTTDNNDASNGSTSSPKAQALSSQNCLRPTIERLNQRQMISLY